MPIRTENKDRYPADWPEIRSRILERAGNCCETCGVKNHAVGYRDPDGTFVEISRNQPIVDAGPEFWVGKPGLGVVKIVLTIMHLDHKPENCDPANLSAACQLCHNRYDAPVRAAGRRLRLRRAIEKAQIALILTSRQAEKGSDATIIVTTHNPNRKAVT